MIDPRDALLIQGFYEAPSMDCRMYYRQVWVRAPFRGYRHALVQASIPGFGMQAADLVNLDADHVVNRARLREWPDAWVLLFPVHRRANRPFGAVEAKLPPIAFGDERVDLDPLLGLKLFCSVLPGREQVDLAMEDVEGQIGLVGPTTRAFLGTMRCEALKLLPGGRRAWKAGRRRCRRTGMSGAC